MRTGVIVTQFCVIVLALAVGATHAQDHLSNLGITAGRAREAVFDSFMSGTISIAGKADAFKGASAAARVTLVNFALSLARAFAESDDFKRRYADHREANGPEPLPEEETADTVLAKQRAGFEEQVEAMKKLFGQITPEQRATLEQGWDDMRRQLTEMETGPRRAELDKALREARTALVRERDLAMKEFEAVYPADARTLVAIRLRKFLDLSTDVAYGARLVDQGGKKVFADPALEAKPVEWKMCFRAGKPATDAARSFVRKWLGDLQAQGIKKG